MFPEFERSGQPVISAQQFLLRLARSGIIALVLIAASLLAGMVGYRVFEGLSWIDAFLDAAMLLGGMGPVHAPVTFGGKLFAGLYALYCGLAVILVAGVILAPVAHRSCTGFTWKAAIGERMYGGGGRFDLDTGTRARAYYAAPGQDQTIPCSPDDSCSPPLPHW